LPMPQIAMYTVVPYPYRKCCPDVVIILWSKGGIDTFGGDNLSDRNLVRLVPLAETNEIGIRLVRGAPE
jgi:hypothetical protein